MRNNIQLRRMLFRQITIALLAAIVLYSTACMHSTVESPEQVIKNYEHQVYQMRADSISQLFTVDGEASHEGMDTVKGRDSIFHMLGAFAGYKMLMNRDSVVDVSAHDDSAVVSGIYIETIAIRKNDTTTTSTDAYDTVHAKGAFTAKMVKGKDQHWLIYNMHTRSL